MPKLGAVRLQTYADAKEFLNGKSSRKLAHNTRVERSGPMIAIRYHQTDIVTFHPCGATVLRNGGWATPTTKRRINLYSPAMLFQKDYKWFLRDEFGRDEPFYDGVTINRRGEIIHRPI